MRIGDLHVSVGAGWQPTVRLRNVFVENAPWASKRPMAVVGEAAFTFDATSIFDDIKVVTQLNLVDAEVSMERLADGLRNWRLTRPDDRGPGHIRVQRLDALRTHIVVTDQVLDLDVDVRAAPIAAPTVVDGVPLASGLTVAGRWRTATFKADVAAPGTLTLRDTGVLFPLRGTLTTGDAQLDIDGKVGDILRQVAVASHVTLHGKSLAGLQPWARIALPSSKPYRIDAQMTKAGSRVDWSQMAATVGRSDASGRFGFERAEGRTALWAELQSRLVDVGDVDAKPVAASASIATRPASTPASGPAGRAGLERLRDVDADLAWRIARIDGTPVDSLRDLQLKANAKAGVVSVARLDVGVAGGQVGGSATLDASGATPTARTHLDVRQVQIGGLLPERNDKKRIVGLVDGGIDLQTEGDAPAAWLAAANGSVHAALTAGSISKLLDAELGLDGSRLIGAWFTDAEQVPIRCANATVDVRAGRATVRALALDTDKTTLTGHGSIDLRTRALDLKLAPRAKSPGLLTLRRDVRISGPLQKPEIHLVDRADGPVAAPCRP